MVPSDSLPLIFAEEAMAVSSMEGRNLARVVSTKEPYFWPAETEGVPLKVVYDFGIKRNILRLMAALGINITIVPWDAHGRSQMNPDGVFSNGPVILPQGKALLKKSAASQFFRFSGSALGTGSRFLALTANLQTQMRTSWREPSCNGLPDQQDRDHKP